MNLVLTLVIWRCMKEAIVTHFGVKTAVVSRALLRDRWQQSCCLSWHIWIAGVMPAVGLAAVTLLG